MAYFSEKELGPKSRTISEITPGTWKGIVLAINQRVEDGSFGYKFPTTCPDGYGTIGSNVNMLADGVEADFPDLKWPLDPKTVPDIYHVLDLIEFAFKHIGAPVKGDASAGAEAASRHGILGAHVDRQQFHDPAHREEQDLDREGRRRRLLLPPDVLRNPARSQRDPSRRIGGSRRNRDKERTAGESW